MTIDDLLNQLPTLPVDRVHAGRRHARGNVCRGEARAVVLMGHSASGKSAVLQWLGAERYRHDMDVYCQQNKHLSALQSFRAMLDVLPEPRVLALRNRPELLRSLRARRTDPPAAHCLFAYLKRPAERIRRNMEKPNTEGLTHRSGFDHETYESMERAYRSLANVELEYSGSSLADLSEAIRAILDAATWRNARSAGRTPFPAQEKDLTWHLDFPDAADLQPDPPGGRTRLAGWAVTRSGRPLELVLRQAGALTCRRLDVERHDVVDFVREHLDQGQPDPRCGFDLQVRLGRHALELGFRLGGSIVWVARLDKSLEFLPYD